MSIIDTLITDRTAADTAALEALFAKARAGSLTEEEKAILADPTHKGAYNYTDLNRVSTALEYLRGRLNGYGYATPGYQRIEVPHRTVVVSKLPEGFTELAYIESSGTQYIDTEFNPNQDSRVVLDAQMLEGSAPTKTQIYFGCRSGGRYFEIYKASSSGQALYFLYNTGGVGEFSVDYTLRRTVEINKNIATVDGVSKEATYAAFQIGRSIFIGADNNDGTAASITSIRIYTCQIYDNGTLVRDYVPVKDANGNVGLYDIVESKFYGNAGSGAFTGGAVVDPPVPSDPSDDETRDPFLWYEDDIPTATQMAQYILNVAVIRGTMEVLPTTPAAPGDMDRLSVEEANAIEFILLDVHTLINNMVAAWFYSGDLYSGEV